jgi:WD40 repeat protein
MVNIKVTFILRLIMGCIFLLTLPAACGPAAVSVVATPTGFVGSATGQTHPSTLTTTPFPTKTATPSAFQVKQLARWGEGPINRTAWSPDGRIIAIAHSGGIALQDAGTLSELSFWETASAAGELAFSPDGQQLAVGELDGRIEMYSLPAGSLRQTIQGHTEFADTLAFSPDGRELLFSDQIEHVHLWDLQSNRAIGASVGLECNICSVGFSSTGQALAWKRDGDVLTIWDVKQGKLLRSLPTTWTLASAFNPDGSQLATGGNDGVLRIWQPDGTGYKLLNSLNGGGPIWSVAYSPDKLVLATGNDQAKIYIWDVPTWRLRVVLPGGSGDVTALQFSPDGKSLLSSSDDGALRLWNAGSGALLQTLEGPATYATGTFLSNGQLWGALENNPETVLLDLTNGIKLQRFQRNMQGAAWSLAISPNGRLVAAEDGYNTIKLVDPGSGKTLHIFADFPGPLYHLIFSPDGRLLAGLFPKDASLAEPTGFLRVWNLSNWDELYSQTTSLAEGLAFSPDGSRFALGGAIGKIFIYETTSGKLLQTLAGHEDAVTSLAFSPDGNTLASGGQDGTIRLWDLQTGAEIRLLDRLSQDVRNSSVPVRIGCLAFSPDGNVLVTGEADGMIRLWNIATGVQIAAFQGHRGEVDTLDFNSDGTQFISGGQDGTLRLWKINP